MLLRCCCAAVGGAYLRLVWRKSVRRHVVSDQVLRIVLTHSSRCRDNHLIIMMPAVARQGSRRTMTACKVSHLPCRDLLPCGDPSVSGSRRTRSARCQPWLEVDTEFPAACSESGMQMATKDFLHGHDKSPPPYANLQAEDRWSRFEPRVHQLHGSDSTVGSSVVVFSSRSLVGTDHHNPADFQSVSSTNDTMIFHLEACGQQLIVFQLCRLYCPFATTQLCGSTVIASPHIFLSSPTSIARGYLASFRRASHNTAARNQPLTPNTSTIYIFS